MFKFKISKKIRRQANTAGHIEKSKYMPNLRKIIVTFVL
jgi:hypothetical protein